MPAIAVIDIRAPHHPEQARCTPPSIGFPVYLVAARVFGAPVDLTRAGIGFLACTGAGSSSSRSISRGMGMGDVKLAALIGAGPRVARARLRGRGRRARRSCSARWEPSWRLLIGRSRKSAIPFGPYLALGAVVAAFWGQQLADWYIDTFLS